MDKPGRCSSHRCHWHYNAWFWELEWPGKCKQFSGALYCIHIASKQNGHYREMCDECRDLPVSERHKGCDSHAGTPFLLTSGSPQTDLTFINASERIKNELAGYVPKPCGQLLPCHVCKIRTCLVSTNSLVDLQTMVMIMVGICLFFRFDDLDGLTAEYFIPEQFVFDPAGNIMGMCLKVFGKSDKDWVTLMLWTDDECPEFCPVRLLLVYIYVSKIKGGFLFPSEAELNNPPSDGIFVTQVSYGVMRERVASLVKDVLGLSGESFKVGLHLLRKTAYLFGIWGNADVATLAKSAQHKCIDTSNGYACNAALIKVHTTIQNNNLNHVKQWKSILLT